MSTSPGPRTGVVPDVGHTGYVRDPEGNIVGLFEDDPNATA